MNTLKPESYYAGFDSKVEEIKGMGFNDARDKLNLDYPPGEKYIGSTNGFFFMQGEADALSAYLKI